MPPGLTLKLNGKPVGLIEPTPAEPGKLDAFFFACAYVE